MSAFLAHGLAPCGVGWGSTGLPAGAALRYLCHAVLLGKHMTDMEKTFGLDKLPDDGEHILVNAAEWKALKTERDALRRAIMSLGGAMKKLQRTVQYHQSKIAPGQPNAPAPEVFEVEPAPLPPVP